MTLSIGGGIEDMGLNLLPAQAADVVLVFYFFKAGCFADARLITEFAAVFETTALWQIQKPWHHAINNTKG